MNCEFQLLPVARHLPLCPLLHRLRSLIRIILQLSDRAQRLRTSRIQPNGQDRHQQLDTILVQQTRRRSADHVFIIFER
jgi:hypothetical protein